VAVKSHVLYLNKNMTKKIDTEKAVEGVVTSKLDPKGGFIDLGINIEKLCQNMGIEYEEPEPQVFKFEDYSKKRK
jgi:hypothetical protein